MPSLVSLAQSFLKPADPTSKNVIRLWRVQLAPHRNEYPQWILSWYSIRVTSKFGIGGAAHVTCRCVRIFLQAFTRRHVSRATCRRSTQDRHHYRSGGSARRMVPRRSRLDQPFGRYSRKCLDTQTSQLKCRSVTFLQPTHYA